MKKLLGFVIFAMIVVVAYMSIQKVLDDKKKKALEEDYARIDTAITSMDQLIHSPAFLCFGDSRTIYQFRFRDIKNLGQDFFAKLSERLGTDFNGKLSNGDDLIGQINLHNQDFWIYAGTTDTQNMIYPNWNYTKVPKK
ncbi:MAG: hypothetical protein IK125_01295 [Lachnospiraceae bacterium]|nr:hypothetical protein [Lachnospiraceae bacterium]